MKSPWISFNALKNGKQYFLQIQMKILFSKLDSRIQQSELFIRRKNSELRIIGAISIDLNGVSDELRLNEVNEETRMKVAHTILKEFCSNSTVHGVRYFTEQNRHWVERFVICL